MEAWKQQRGVAEYHQVQGMWIREDGSFHQHVRGQHFTEWESFSSTLGALRSNFAQLEEIKGQSAGWQVNKGGLKVMSARIKLHWGDFWGEAGGGQGTEKRRARKDNQRKAPLGVIRQRWYSPSLGWQRVAELRHTHTHHHDQRQTTAESRHKWEEKARREGASPGLHTNVGANVREFGGEWVCVCEGEIHSSVERNTRALALSLQSLATVTCKGYVQTPPSLSPSLFFSFVLQIPLSYPYLIPQFPGYPHLPIPLIKTRLPHSRRPHTWGNIYLKYCSWPPKYCWWAIQPVYCPFWVWFGIGDLSPSHIFFMVSSHSDSLSPG